MIHVIKEQPIIRYPKCGGGHWLGNLVWQLQNSQWTVPRKRIVFDGLPQGSINLAHWFESHAESTPCFYFPDYKENKLFSTDRKFNMYLNYCVKSRYGFYHIEQLPLAEQVLDLSNTANFVLTNSYVDQYYCHNIDLDYAWIFQDPERFIDWILAFLNTHNISYVEQRDHMLTSIANYKTTCADPKDIVDNQNSTIWLGWCHAIGLIENIDITGQIIQQDNLKSIAEILKPTHKQAKQIAEENLFYWTYEHTTS